MKKIIFLFALTLFSTTAFSQLDGSGINSAIDIIKVDPGSKPIINTNNNPLIDEINRLTLEYLNLKAEEVQYGFTTQDSSKLETKDDVFREYIIYLKNKMESDKSQIMKKNDENILKYFKVPRVKNLDNNERM